jgi:hypothetical protein
MGRTRNSGMCDHGVPIEFLTQIEPLGNEGKIELAHCVCNRIR